MSLQILIADDHELFRRSLRSLLESHPGWSVCGEAVDGREAVAYASELEPDVILLDVSMPEMNGLEAARLIRKHTPEAQILIISQNEAELMRKAADEVGAKGFIEKSKLSQELMKAVEKLTPKEIVAGSNGRPHSATGSDGSSPETSLAWLTGGGEMGALIRSMDWSGTPLGRLENWPQSLRTTISLSLSSNFPINIVWGPGYNQIYNDGYRVVVGERHPEGMGMPYDKCWASAWPAIGKPFERAWLGETSFLENQRMYLTRNGYLEETFFTFSLSPIRDQNGIVVGLFHPVTETTAKMLSERRTRSLRELAANTSEARSLEAAFALIAKTLAEHELDLPFVLLYSLSKDGKEARLLESIGIEPGLGPTQPVIRLDTGEGCVWPLDRVRASDEIIEIDNLHTHFGGVACGPYEEGTSRAVAHALRLPGESSPLGFFIAGVSPRLPFNQNYKDYLRQVSGAIAAALANALAYEREKQRGEALAEIDRAKTAFFSNISHEFRTPLTLMMGPLEDAIARSEHFPEPDREGLQLAHRNSLRLLKLVNTLLDFSRIEAGRIQACFEAVDLATFTAELASVFRSAIERAGMRLVVDCPQLPEQVYVDREMWEKIVLNLLSNAFKFTFEGEIGVSLRAVDASVELTVRDTGTGVPEEEIARLFERFHRVKNARGRSYEGSGIGLALVQELVKLHVGTVRVESQLNRGSAFIVRIPLGKEHLPADRIGGERNIASTGLRGAAYLEEAVRWLPDTEKLPADIRLDLPSLTTSAAEAPKSSGPPALILLADDNADMREYVRKLLSKKYEVLAVADGESALKLARERRPDLVLSDIMMPRLDGFALLREIRADQTLSAVPVILLSARAGEESRVEGLDAGADDYLAKPFSARELLARVGSHLSMSKVRQQAAESERNLRRDAELLAAIVASSDDAIISKNLDGVITSWNKSAERIFGYSAHEAIGKPITLIIPTDRLDEEVEIISKLRRGERVDHFETIRMRKDRGMVEVSLTISPIKDASGHVTGASKVARDITATRQADRALRESEARFRTIIETTPECVKLVAADGTLLQMNSVGLDMVGATSAEKVLGNCVYDIIAPEDRERFRSFNETICAGGKGSLQFDIISLDGVRRHMDTYAVPFLMSEGAVVQLAVTRDVTEQKRAEKALADAARQQRALFHLADGLHRANSFEEIYSAALDAICEALRCDRASILRYDDAGTMQFVSWRGLSETYRKAVAGHSPWKRNQSNPQPICVENIESADLDAELKNTIRNENINSLVFVPLVSHGTLIGKFMVYFADPHVFTGDELNWSITIARQLAFSIERKIGVEALLRSEEQSRKLSETLEAEVRLRTRELEGRNADVLMQSELLRDLSRRLLQAQDEERRRIARELHDSAGQTLTVLGMTLAMIAQDSQSQPPELSQGVQEAEQLVQQLHQEIRTMSYLLHPPLLDEAGLVAALTWYIEGLTTRSGLQLSLSIPDNFARLPRDMELVVFRVVQECLTNIHRHSGSKTAAIRIAREMGCIKLEVQDSGKGISPEKLAELHSSGSGVGIRGMRERVRQFHGEIQIDSSTSGTRILVSIPVPKAAVQQLSHPLEAAV